MTPLGTNKIPRLEKHGDAFRLIVNEKPFISLAGEVHNSSSSNLEYMNRYVWGRLVYFNCNTAVVPVSWELIEPVEGKFDFTLVEGLIEGARKNNLKLVLIWFGMWKNSHSTYVPAWVKRDSLRFPRVQSAGGKRLPIVSCHSDEALQADSKAFAALMKYIQQADSIEQTVIMVQVENEVGFLGTARDYSPQASALFDEDVPDELIQYLKQHTLQLTPFLKKHLNNKHTGLVSWTELFGSAAEEIFTAWHMSRFIDQVTAAGKAEYNLPMFVNVWLKQYEEQDPGQYPSGAPNQNVIDIWKAGGPHIDIIAPDIYLNEFAQVCEVYTRPDNPLFIPETRRDKVTVANVFYAIGEHHALGYTPFGIETMDNGIDPWSAGFLPPNHFMVMESAGVGPILSKSYDLLHHMAPVITQYYGTRQMRGILQDKAYPSAIRLGGYRLQIRFRNRLDSDAVPAGGLIIAVSDHEYIIAGHGFGVEFTSLKPGVSVDFISIDEGWYKVGDWVPGRRLNGDEYRASLGSDPQVLKVSLYSY
ncbi:DUF5597 domain-containing protein [Paenibacillus sp. S150]|uniref:GH35 family beta-galactosidase n=1 Tax=Paenibacillus sp. S150 TaxID=2749826 RepID=UPI001C59B8A1|nr:DUF5597 domain-containing protein [Paenibacillus sp. S150]MBW4079952.1 DUF5597 domain-containing protein [Paenibacillus sp. S150]